MAECLDARWGIDSRPPAATDLPATATEEADPQGVGRAVCLESTGRPLTGRT